LNFELEKELLMKQVYIIHSRGAGPHSHWYPYVKQMLEAAGFTVHTPPMPKPEAPHQSAWLTAMSEQIQTVNEDTFLIGHSVGCQAVLRFLDRLPIGQKAGGVVLVAGWVSVPNWAGRTAAQKAILNDWLNPPLDFTKIAERSSHFTAIFSDNDPFVPKENWEVCENELRAKIIVKHQAGHFEGEDTTELPEVVEAISAAAK
jgi:serine hydrolase